MNSDGHAAVKLNFGIATRAHQHCRAYVLFSFFKKKYICFFKSSFGELSWRCLESGLQRRYSANQMSWRCGVGAVVLAHPFFTCNHPATARARLGTLLDLQQSC